MTVIVASRRLETKHQAPMTNGQILDCGFAIADCRLTDL